MTKAKAFVSLSYKKGDANYQNNESKLICELLNKKGYKCILFDWRDLFDGCSNADREMILSSHCIVHKHVGPIRKGKNHNFVSYLDTIRKLYPNAIINSRESYNYGIRKTYLLELQNNGFPIVPTISLQSNCTLENLRVQDNYCGAQDFVLKPCDGELGQDVMLGSEITESMLERAAKRTDLFLVQPFLEGVRLGEKSVVGIAIGGEYFPIYGVVRVPKAWKSVSSQCKHIVEAEVNEYEKNLVSELFRSNNFSFFRSGFFRVDFIYHNQVGFLSEVEIVNPQGGLEYIQVNKVKKYMEYFINMLKFCSENV